MNVSRYWEVAGRAEEVAPRLSFPYTLYGPREEKMSFLKLLDIMIQCATAGIPTCSACRAIPVVPDESIFGSFK